MIEPIPDKIPVPDTGYIPLPNGCTLYWKTDHSVGCRIYYSDEVGGFVEVWHTALVDSSTLLAAIVQETTLDRKDRVNKDRLKKYYDKLMRENNAKCPYCSFNPISRSDYCDYHRPAEELKIDID
jgi:hypothetical protein